MTKRILLYIAATAVTANLSARTLNSSRPSLVVNIVVSGMRAVDVERYQENFAEGGLKALYEDGLRYDNCQYSYKQTTTPVSLSTIATGAQPSTHGVVGDSWYDYVTNEQVDLLADKNVENIAYSLYAGGYSSQNLHVPTLSETLLKDSPQSDAVTVALDPISSITLGGEGRLFWFDGQTCNWASSTAYMDALPWWVMEHNRSESDITRTTSKWGMSFPSSKYINSRYFPIAGGYILGNEAKINPREERSLRYAKYYERICSSPIGNDIVAAFAKLAVASLSLGADEHVDILNICFDASRNIVEKYGPESIEAEDMYYKLDRTIADLIRFVNSQVKDANVVYLLTSDHGTSPSVPVDGERFNPRQFEVILNGFLSVRYGNEPWVLGYKNGAIYLNHNSVYKKGLSLAEVQNEAATFALQLQGVSHAVTSAALSSSYFGNGFAQRIQNGFYQRRSGDVIINFMPNWIERDVTRMSQSGSMYNYDRAVPLIIYGSNIPKQVVSREVDVISIAPTLAAIMDIAEPAASEGAALKELTNFKDNE